MCLVSIYYYCYTHGSVLALAVCLRTLADTGTDVCALSPETGGRITRPDFKRWGLQNKAGRWRRLEAASEGFQQGARGSPGGAVGRELVAGACASRQGQVDGRD